MGTKHLPKILIMEGNAQRREVFRKALADLGATRILFVSTVRSAIVALKKTPFDLLVLHGDVAQEKDFTLLRAIRRDKILQSLSVVVFHPACSDEVSRSTLEAGASMCIAQSFEPVAVRNVVMAALRSDGPVLTHDVTSVAFPDPVDDAEDAKRLCHTGMELLKKGDYLRAVKIFSAALKRNHTMPEIHVGIGEAYSKLGEAVKAFRFRHVAVVELLLSGQSSHAQMLYRRMGSAPDGMQAKLANPFLLAGKQLLKKGKAEFALRVLEEGSALAPESTRLRKELAETYMLVGETEQAVHILEEVGIHSHFLSQQATQHAEAQVDAPASHAESTCSGSGETSGDFYCEENSSQPVKWEEKRSSRRVSLADYSVILGWRDVPHPVVDVSMGGLCFKAEGKDFEHGQIIKCTLVDEDGVRVKKMQAVIRYVGKNRIGVQFLELSARQNKELAHVLQVEAVKQGISDIVQDGPTREVDGKIIVDLDMW